MTTLNAQTLAFGVEIECYMPSNVCPQRRSHIDGLEIDWAPEGWQAKRDGSLTARTPMGYTGVEIVSPKLAGEEGLCEVVYIADTLVEKGAIVNDACGLHIHVDATSLTAEQIQAVKALFVSFEKALFTLCGEKAAARFSNRTYCKNSAQWVAGQDLTDRYRSLNLSNTARSDGKRTIEFRLFAGCVDAETIITAIQTVVALVVKAANGTPIKQTKTTRTFVKEMVKDALIVPDCSYSDLLLVAAMKGEQATI